MLRMKTRKNQLAVTGIKFAILTAFDQKIGTENEHNREPMDEAVQKLKKSRLGQNTEDFLEKYESAYHWVYGKWKSHIKRVCLRGFSLVLESNLCLTIDCKVSLALFPKDVSILEIFFEINKDCFMKGNKIGNKKWALCTDELIYFRHLLLEEDHIDERMFRVDGFFEKHNAGLNNFGTYVAEYINEIRKILEIPNSDKSPIDTVTSIQISSFANTSNMVKNHQIIENALQTVRRELIGLIQTDEDWRSLRTNSLDKYFASLSCYYRKKYLIALTEYSSTLVVCTSYKDPLRLQENYLWKDAYSQLPRVANLYKIEPEKHINSLEANSNNMHILSNMKNQHALYDEFSLYIRFLLLRIRLVFEKENTITSLEPRTIAKMQMQTLNVANEIESLELLRREMLRATSLNKMLEATFIGREINIIEKTINSKLEMLGSAIDRETLFSSEKANRALALLGIILATSFGLDLARIAGYFLYLGEYNAKQPWFIWQYGILNALFFFITLLLLVGYFIIVSKIARQSKK